MKSFEYIRNNKQVESNLAKKYPSVGQELSRGHIRVVHWWRHCLVSQGAPSHPTRRHQCNTFLQLIFHFISAIASHITSDNKQQLLFFSRIVHSLFTFVGCTCHKHNHWTSFSHPLGQNLSTVLRSTKWPSSVLWKTGKAPFNETYIKLSYMNYIVLDTAVFENISNMPLFK